MIIFHAAWDMKTFQLIELNFSDGFWYAFPRVIAFTFLFCVGVSLNFTHVPRINWSALTKRSLKLGAAALIISVSTYFLFPTSWIYFGTLHCIFLGSILGALVVNYRRLSLLLMLTIVILQYGVGYDIKWVSSVLKKPSMDFIPIYPWFWAILLGILIGPHLSKSKQLERIPVPSVLKFLGTHSLKIYLIHQPVLYGLLWLLTAFI
jgi:uncharacterized membrane protein